MSKQLTKDELKELINVAVEKLNLLLTDLGNDTKNAFAFKRAGLIAYWLIDYVKMLRYETVFDSTKLIRYNRGDVVCVNFGYRIGNELGGRHFAFVLDNYNSLKSGVVTVIPLTSKKENYVSNCFSHELQFGLYELHNEKLKKLIDEQKSELNTIDSQIDVIDTEQLNPIANKVKKISQKSVEMKNLEKSILKLKEGTIANLGQVTTISKIRIVNPKQASDSLGKIKINPADLDVITEKLNYLYSRHKKEF